MQILGIGDIAVSRDTTETLKTVSLGAGIAVILYDPKVHAAGMAHVILPSTERLEPAEKERCARLPGYCADTAVPELLARFRALSGVQLKRTEIKLVGGARLLEMDPERTMGWRTAQGLGAALARRGLAATAQNLGGALNRSVSIDVADGSVIVYAPGRGQWPL